MKIPLYVKFNLLLAAVVGLGLWSVFYANSLREAEQATALERAIDGVINDWISRGVPPGAGRTITIMLSEASREQGLMEAAPPPRFLPSLGSWLLRGLVGPRKPNYPGIMAEAGLPLVDWRLETLVWAQDKERRYDALIRVLSKAGGAQARIHLIAQGSAIGTALEAVRRSPQEVAIARLVALGASRLRLSRDSSSEAPPRVGEFICLWSEGSSTGRGPGGFSIEYQDSEGRWNTLGVNGLFLSESGRPLGSDAELFRRIRDFLAQERTLEEFLIQAKLLKPTLTGHWTGLYFYPEQGYTPPRQPVSFTARLKQMGEGFEGVMVEPNTFGDNTSSVLKALIINGQVDAENNLRFIKKYDGTAGQSHSVEYKGALSPDGKNMTGVWTLLRKASGAQASGRFEMMRQKPPADRSDAVRLARP